MASVDDNFDPNDLDSIDALLDEAEQEVSDNLGSDSVAGKTDLDDLDDFDFDSLSSDLETESLADVSVDSLGDQSISTVDELPNEPVLEEPLVAPAAVEKPTAKKSMADSEEEFVPKRPKSNKSSPNEMSVAEMDSIKKLVIIFGSVLIVLVLTAIGMGIWSALAASGGLDEEMQTMIEDIQASTVNNTITGSESIKTMNSVEKKLDALSFQLEQLTADITALENNSLAVAGEAVNPITAVTAPKLDSHGQPVAEAHVNMVPAVTPVAHVPAVTDQAVLEKLNVVSSKLVTTQRGINEVNKRVKSMQTQYSQLMHSVKVVEKQLLDQQAKAAKEAKEAEKPATDDRSAYQYNRTLDGMMYDQANPDSYP